MMKILDLLHRWTGGLIGLILALLGLTGALLVHKDAWIMLPHAADTQVTETSSVAAVVTRIMADPATRPRGIIFASQNFGLHRLSYKGGAGAYVDQAGRMVTHWNSQWKRPELWLLDLHQHLFASERGKIVVGIAGLCGLFFVVSGTVLWWRTRRTFALRLLPKRLSRPAIVRHHRDLGIVMAPVLALSLYTGVTMVFRPITALVLGPSAPAIIDKAMKPPLPAGAAPADRLDWAAMMRTARKRFPDAEFRELSMPRKNSGFITLRMKQPGEWLPNGRTVLYFAADTGALVDTRDAFALPVQARRYNMLFPLHAAKVGGLLYRLLMTLSGLALTMLGSLVVWTFWAGKNARRPKARPQLLRRSKSRS